LSDKKKGKTIMRAKVWAFNMRWELLQGDTLII